MSSFFQSLREAIEGLKNVGAMLEELRAARAELRQHLNLIANYAEQLREIRRQLDSTLAKFPFK